MYITDEAADAAWSAFTSLGVYASDKARLTKALEALEAALPHLAKGAVGGGVMTADEKLIRQLRRVGTTNGHDNSVVMRAADRLENLAPVGVTEELKSAEARILELEADLEIANDKLRVANEALEPFVRHLNEMRFDLDHEGNELPGEQTCGCIYLTLADFRRARAALRAKAQEASE